MNKKQLMFIAILMIYIASIMAIAHAQGDEEQTTQQNEQEGHWYDFFVDPIKGYFTEKAQETGKKFTESVKDFILGTICRYVWWLILAFFVVFWKFSRLSGLNRIINSMEEAILTGFGSIIALWIFFRHCSPSLLLWILAISSAIDMIFGLKNVLIGIGGSVKPGDAKELLSKAGMLARFGKGAKTAEERKQLQELERELQPRRIRTLLVIYEEMLMEDYVAKGMGYRVEDAQRTIIDTIADARGIEKKLAEEKFHMWKRLKGME